MCGQVDYVLSVCYSYSCEYGLMSIDYIEKLQLFGVLV